MFQFSCRLSCCLVYSRPFFSSGFPVLSSGRKFRLINQNGPSKINRGQAKLRPNFCQIYICRKGQARGWTFRFWAAGSWWRIFYIFSSHSHRQLFSEIFFFFIVSLLKVWIILLCIAYLCKIARIWYDRASPLFRFSLFFTDHWKLNPLKASYVHQSVQALGHLRASTGLGGVNEEIGTFARLRVKIFYRY